MNILIYSCDKPKCSLQTYTYIDKCINAHEAAEGWPPAQFITILIFSYPLSHSLYAVSSLCLNILFSY